MTTGYFKKLMIALIILSLPAFLVIANVTNPGNGFVPKIIFLSSLFVLIFAFYSLTSYAARKKLSNNEVGHSAMKSSVRQGTILATFAILSLLLAAIRLLIWWDVLLLAFSLVLIELYFTSDKAGVS